VVLTKASKSAIEQHLPLILSYNIAVKPCLRTAQFKNSGSRHLSLDTENFDVSLLYNDT